MEDRMTNLRRRVQCLKSHIAYLRSIFLTPSSCDAEIRRREALILQARESIRLHEEAIKQIRHEIEHAPELIAEATKRLQSLQREANAHLIERLSQEYFKTFLSLKEICDARSDTEM